MSLVRTDDEIPPLPRTFLARAHTPPTLTHLPSPDPSSPPDPRMGLGAADIDTDTAMRGRDRGSMPDRESLDSTDSAAAGGRERRVRKSVNYAEPKLNTYVTPSDFISLGWGRDPLAPDMRMCGAVFLFFDFHSLFD